MLLIWNELTRNELRDLLPEAVVVFPTGATEQHGPHLATGHDTFSVTEVAHRAAEIATCNVVVAPTLPFGSSHHHLSFGGTLSLSTDTYSRLMTDVVTSMVTGGARRIFLLNGHGGNQELNQLTARDVALQQSAEAPVVIAAASYWQIAASSLATMSGLEGIPLPGHAGAFETSTMLATTPRRVREEHLLRRTEPLIQPVIDGVRIEASNAWQTFDGHTDYPNMATAALGRAILDLVERDVAAAFDALLEHPFFAREVTRY